MMQPSPPIEWPPPYKVKKHIRAKHVKLRASSPHGLEITVPTRFNLKDIPSILEEHKSWIIKQLLRLDVKAIDELPNSIHLPAINAIWQIQYESCQTKLEMIERPNHELVFIGNMEDKNGCKQKLLEWVKQEAKKYLSNMMCALSEWMQLSYTKMTVRDQKTLWGSCTSKKTISLNYKLMFLPKHLIQYVLIHELCHTVHFNHSTRFWALVQKYDPNWRQHKRELRESNAMMPSWI